ncbi:TPA: DUF3150 domain-containing protein [Pseudomonas aeruginosa]|nr:DUF3150 domain-containing protein [Pseudomonas aeruginosa]EIU2862471.1 DUF3150 domain-containing protein [Pseudomonas aeruginosa]
MQNRQINVLSKILLVGIQVNIWSARKKLEAKDLGLDEKTVPPAELASLGTLRSINPEYIQEFEQLRRKAKRTVERMGLRFMGVVAIPEEKAAAAVAELEAVEKEFHALRDRFLASYDKAVLDWTNRPMPTKALKEAVVRAIVPKAQVAERIGFRFSLCRISPDDSPELNKQLVREVQGLHGQLFSEIADTADSLLQKSFSGRDKVGQKAVNCIRRIHEKLLSLAFLDPTVQALADHVQAKLVDFPTKGNVEGAKLQELVSLLTNLSDETKIEKLIHLFNGAQSGVQVDQSLIEDDADAPAVEVATSLMGSSTEAFDFVAANLDLTPAVVVPEASPNPIDETYVDSVVAQGLQQEAPASTADFCL